MIFVMDRVSSNVFKFFFFSFFGDEVVTHGLTLRYVEYKNQLITSNIFGDIQPCVEGEEPPQYPQTVPSHCQRLQPTSFPSVHLFRLILMRYFQLSVEEFEQSYNPNNAELIILDRCMSDDLDKEYFRLRKSSRRALNLQGDVSTERPVFLRRDRFEFV